MNMLIHVLSALSRKSDMFCMLFQIALTEFIVFSRGQIFNEVQITRRVRGVSIPGGLQ